MEHLLNDHKDQPNQHNNSHELCNETEHPVLSLLGSQWKLRQHDQNFPLEGKPLKNKYLHQEINKSKRAGL